ncbi:serine hydrolase domain-containing protein [Streptosporangium carneum]|uniref:Serine hydrolase n=1 Tax=Streptosporangium carneum TaxID=47481 RepID=A0A9W6ME47_9ACTN|nr:serine hydrolase domain-containing protein [Streptosporangium carneum]GLK10585.1 serine hydrolase [Streptosporangium carneum]
MGERLSSGVTIPGFERVRERFEALRAEDPEYSAAVAAYVDGELVVDLWGGPRLREDSILTTFSCTKGVSGVCVALLVERGLLDLDDPVSKYWPEFGVRGKAAVTVRDLLSHQVGLIGVDGGFTVEDLLRHEELAERLARQRPYWQPKAGHGYHALTIGVLADELVRRTAGRTLAEFYTEEIRLPRDIDFFVGLPETEEGRVVPVLAPELPSAPASPPQAEAVFAPGTLGGAAMTPGPDFPPLPELANTPAVHRAGPPSMGGVGSARGLAKLYACCVGDVGGARLLSAETVEAVSRLQTVGDDLVLGTPTRFATLFQKAGGPLSYGSHRAFGHDGVGGCVGFADPEDGLCFGYTTPQMPFPGGADARGLALAATVRECAADLG